MKFKVKVGALLETINIVASTIDKKKDSGGTGYLFLAAYKNETASALLLYSTNVVLETTKKIDAEVEEAGRVLVDHQKLRSGLLNRDPEAYAEFKMVEETATKGGTKRPAHLEIRVGKTGKINLSFMPAGTDLMADRMGQIPFRHGGHYKVSGRNLSEFVKRASFCISDDIIDTRVPAGMRLMTTTSGYEAQATDGFACARIIIKGDKNNHETGTTLLPQLALRSLTGLVKTEDEVTVIEGVKNVRGDISKLFFKIGNNTFFGTSLLTDRLPNIAQVLDQHKPDYWFKINRSAFAQALERAAGFDDKHHVRLEVECNTLKISARDVGNVSGINDELQIEWEDGVPEDFRTVVTVNLNYVKNAVQASTQEFIRIGFNDWNDKSKRAKGVVIDDTQETLDAQYVVMPLYQ